MSGLLFLVALAPQADDWPEFRGPTAQGLSAAVGLPVEWGPEKNVAWKRPLPGLGWSSPVLHRGRVYLTTAVPLEGKKHHRLLALCMDAKTGEPAWETEVFGRAEGAPRFRPENSHASPTPVVDRGRLYVHFGYQGTACLDLAGEVLWRSPPPPYDPEDGNGGSPLLVEDALIVNHDGKDRQFVLALDRTSGKALWNVDRRTRAKEKYAYSTPLLVTVDGRGLAVSPAAGVVCAYDPKTGEEVWRVEYGNGYSVVPRPVSGHGLVFVCTGFDKPRLLAIRPDGRGDVTATHVAWTVDRAVPHIASPVLVGDELYVVSDVGVASCLDAKTGKEHWRERLGGKHWSSPLHADGKVYFQNVEGVGFVVKAGRRFELLARNTLEKQVLASYAVGDGALFIRTEKHLYRIQNR